MLEHHVRELYVYLKTYATHSNMDENKIIQHIHSKIEHTDKSTGDLTEEDGVCPHFLYCGSSLDAECPMCDGHKNHPERLSGKGWKEESQKNYESDDSLPDLVSVDDDEDDSLPDLVSEDDDEDDSLPDLASEDDDKDNDEKQKENLSGDEKDDSDGSFTMSFVDWWKIELPKNKKRYERSNRMAENQNFEEALEESEDACDSIDDMLSANVPMSPEEIEEVNSLKQKLLLQCSSTYYA